MPFACGIDPQNVGKSSSTSSRRSRQRSASCQPNHCSVPIVSVAAFTSSTWIITGCEKAAKKQRRAMDEDWFRSIGNEYDAAEVSLFHKQYYQGPKLLFDGLIEGFVRKDWPYVTCFADAA